MAGVLLITQSLLALGVVPRRYWTKFAGGGSVCLAGTFVGPFLASPSWSHVLVAGVLTGFLPCGLVYGYLALASSSASIWTGLLTMSVFGAGTGPLMILSGTGGSLISHASRGKFLKISAICVGLTGLISIVRGILFMQLTPAPEVVRCHFLWRARRVISIGRTACAARIASPARFANDLQTRDRVLATIQGSVIGALVRDIPRKGTASRLPETRMSEHSVPPGGGGYFSCIV